ncbi:MAG TPA: phosphoglycerate dehydrogenase [Corynebacteriales bacterium]|jgi:phosphoglycerate dehydrogenase-like enzyme|nr:phosphoglycerate dehydrogenase [Mycobacteriales bacterium]
MHTILVASTSFGLGEERSRLQDLFSSYDLIPHFTRLSEASKNPASLAACDGIIIGTERITTEHFEKATRLKAVIKYGVGTDNIDKEAAAHYGVKVLNLPGINCDAVAELALGLMITAARRIAGGDGSIREGQWLKLVGVSVQGKVLGIIGTGAIGKALAKLVTGLEMELLGYDIRRDEGFAALGGTYVDLATLLRRSDFVSLHTPLDESTYHMIGKKELALMKESAILINTSRGPVVDENALYDALKRKQIKGAALDVFETEPLTDSRLLEIEGLVCTPHIAAYSHEVLRRMDRKCVEKLAGALNAV